MRIGIIGIGAMGWNVARAFMRGPNEVLVRDIRDEANEIAELGGATVCASPAAIARESDAILTFVVDGPQTEEIMFGTDGAAAALKPGQLVLLCSTMAADEVASIGARLAERGAVVLDTPVSGGPDHAREGALTMMVACTRAALDQARPVFDYMARDVFHISETLGDGARVKLVNNMLAGTNLTATAEALSFGAKLGLDLSMLFNVVRHSSGQSWIGDDRYRRLLVGDHVRRSSPEILAKDLRLAMKLAHDAGFEPVLARDAAGIFDEVGTRFGAYDDAEVVRWYDERAGTRVVSRLASPPA